MYNSQIAKSLQITWLKVKKLTCQTQKQSQIEFYNYERTKSEKEISEIHRKT